MGVRRLAGLAIFEFTRQALESKPPGFIAARQKSWLEGTARGMRSCSVSSAVAGISVVVIGNCVVFAFLLSNEEIRPAALAQFSNEGYLTALGAGLLAGAVLLAFGVLFTRHMAARLVEPILSMERPRA